MIKKITKFFRKHDFEESSSLIQLPDGAIIPWGVLTCRKCGDKKLWIIALSGLMAFLFYHGCDRKERVS